MCPRRGVSARQVGRLPQCTVHGRAAARFGRQADFFRSIAAANADFSRHRTQTPCPDRISGMSRFWTDSSSPMDAIALAAAIEDGSTTSSRQVEQALDRLDAVNPVLNLLAWPGSEAAKIQARNRQTGRLAGVPTMIKDHVAQKGLPNSFGATALRYRVERQDAPLSSVADRVSAGGGDRYLRLFHGKDIRCPPIWCDLRKPAWNLMGRNCHRADRGRYPARDQRKLRHSPSDRRACLHRQRGRHGTAQR